MFPEEVRVEIPSFGGEDVLRFRRPARGLPARGVPAPTKEHPEDSQKQEIHAQELFTSITHYYL